MSSFPITKADLAFSYNRGNPLTDNLLLRGEPDRSLLNRNESWEMVYFLNRFATKHAQPKTTVNLRGVATKAERLVKQHLPSGIRSHDNVEAWLINNWSKYL